MKGTVTTIGPTAVAVPEHLLTQADVKQAVAALVPLRPERLEAVMSLFDGAGVDRRYSVLPVEGLHQRRDMTETMEIYRRHAIRLGRQVARECLEKAALPATAVDLVITVSCTGVMLPSLCAYLANELGFRADVRRLPITELGCLGGAAALSHARDFIAGHPGANVLVVSVELPTLSFQRQDLTAANLISTALFGDGAAAVLLTGREIPGARMIDTRSHIFPRTLDALGFDLKSDGFHVVLGRELPGLVRADIKGLVGALLADNEIPRRDLTAFVLHPGGRRILDAVEDQLQLHPEETGPSREVLRAYGNVSSATVLFVLHAWQGERRPASGAHGLLGAFGPGFSSELAVLQWNSTWSLPAFTGLVVAVGAGRLIELVISQRRRRGLRARGASPVAERHFLAMVLLHAGILGGSIAEAWIAARPVIPWLALLALGLVFGASLLRWWVIATLGPHWNVRIMSSLSLGVVTDGPYRFIRHPNYLAVFVELGALPLVHGAYLTALGGAAAHVWVLAQRIRAEEEVLHSDPGYRSAMGDKPRFLPWPRALR